MSKKKQFSGNNSQLTAQAFYILLSLATKERHGYDIMKQVEKDSQGKLMLGPGTLYGAIKRMLEDKLIVEVETSFNRRRYYKLTQKGRSIFLQELQRLKSIVELAEQKNFFASPLTAKITFAYA